MDISIIVVNWNTAELTLQCLESIYHSKSKLTFEIIVVDNGSTDESVSAISDRFSDVRIITNSENLGFAKANNQGISEGKGRYYLLLNSDTLVLPGALEKMVHIADTDQSIGVVGPKLLNMDDTLQKSWASFPTLLSELLGQNFRFRKKAPQIPDAYEVDWIMGACMLVRSNVIKDVGAMDDDYFMYSEETDWCYRIKRGGWKVIYLSNVAIYHLGGGSASRGSLTQLALLYQSKILFFQKHYGKYLAVVLRYGLAISNTVGLIRRTLFRRGRDKNVVQQRLEAQAKLILCLLKDQYPLISRR